MTNLLIIIFTHALILINYKPEKKTNLALREACSVVKLCITNLTNYFPVTFVAIVKDMCKNVLHVRLEWHLLALFDHYMPKVQTIDQQQLSTTNEKCLVIRISNGIIATVRLLNFRTPKYFAIFIIKSYPDRKADNFSSSKGCHLKCLPGMPI